MLGVGVDAANAACSRAAEKKRIQEETRQRLQRRQDALHGQLMNCTVHQDSMKEGQVGLASAATRDRKRITVAVCLWCTLWCALIRRSAWMSLACAWSRNALKRRAMKLIRWSSGKRQPWMKSLGV